MYYSTYFYWYFEYLTMVAGKCYILCYIKMYRIMRYCVHTLQFFSPNRVCMCVWVKICVCVHASCLQGGWQAEIQIIQPRLEIIWKQCHHHIIYLTESTDKLIIQLQYLQLGLYLGYNKNKQTIYRICIRIVSVMHLCNSSFKHVTSVGLYSEM